MCEQKWRQRDKKLLRAIDTEEGRRRVGFDPDDITLADLVRQESDVVSALQEAHEHEHREQLHALDDVLQMPGLPAVDSKRAAVAMCRNAKPPNDGVTFAKLY